MSLIYPTVEEDVKQEENQPFLDSFDQTEDGRSDGTTETWRTIEEMFQDTLPAVYARRGLLWLSVSVFFQAAQIIALTDLSKKMGATQIIFLRSSFILISVLGISWRKSESYKFFDMVIFTFNAFAEVVFIYSTALAGQFIWVGDITSISMNQQVPSAILATILLGETLNKIDGVFVVLNAIGVVLVSQPSFLFSNSHQFVSSSELVWPGFLFAFAALIGCISGTLLYRTIVYRKVEDVFLVTALTGMIGLLVSSCVATIMSSWKFPEPNWSMILVLGIFTLLTMIPYNKALETENVKTVTVMLTVVIPLTTLYDFIVLGRDLNLANIGGVLLILGSSFAIHVKTAWTSQ